MEDKIFALYTPSVFVIDSPFQALCAVSAIRQLKISECRVLAVFTNNKQRNETIKNVLLHFQIPFISVTFTPLSYKYYQFSSMIKRKSGYKRLFIGFYDAPFQHTVGCCNIADGASVVYLDDGAANINLFQHKTITSISDFHEKKWLHVIERRRHVSFYKNFLTIYNDIPNTAYSIAPLNLSTLFDNTKSKLQENVYIVGTHSQSYFNHIAISENTFITKLDSLFFNLKKEYPSEKIVYIPHRSDSSEYAQKLCCKYGCEFRVVDMTIEMELSQQLHAPKAIFGFTSSALFNLKKIYPHTRVVNILIIPQKETAHFRDFLKISEYYQHNGIELLQK